MVMTIVLKKGRNEMERRRFLKQLGLMGVFVFVFDTIRDLIFFLLGMKPIDTQNREKIERPDGRRSRRGR